MASLLTFSGWILSGLNRIVPKEVISTSNSTLKTSQSPNSNKWTQKSRQATVASPLLWTHTSRLVTITSFMLMEWNYKTSHNRKVIFQTFSLEPQKMVYSMGTVGQVTQPILISLMRMRKITGANSLNMKLSKDLATCTRFGTIWTSLLCSAHLHTLCQWKWFTTELMVKALSTETSTMRTVLSIKEVPLEVCLLETTTRDVHLFWQEVSS